MVCRQNPWDRWNQQYLPQQASHPGTQSPTESPECHQAPAMSKILCPMSEEQHNSTLSIIPIVSQNNKEIYKDRRTDRRIIKTTDKLNNPKEKQKWRFLCSPILQEWLKLLIRSSSFLHLLRPCLPDHKPFSLPPYPHCPSSPFLLSLSLLPFLYEVINHFLPVQF